VVAMIILCIVVLLTYSFLNQFSSREKPLSFEFLSFFPEQNRMDTIDFRSLKRIDFRYGESNFENMQEIEVTYYKSDGRVLMRRNFLKEFDKETSVLSNSRSW
jgi:hypothetical protein